MASPSEAVKPWYTDQKFDRYWEHYNSCFAWMRMHQQSAGRVAAENSAEMWKRWSEYATQMYHYHRNQQAASPTPSGINPHVNAMPDVSSFSSTRNSKRKSSSRPSSRLKRKAKKRREQQRAESVATSQCEMDKMEVDEDMDEDFANQDEDEEDVMCEIPYSDDLVKFLSASARHRKQRDAEKRIAEKKEKENEYVENFDKTYQVTSRAPTERPGQRRTAEMKLLYGKGAAMIHGMETAMQLTFDRNCDLKQPKHWPNLPLNIKFN